MDAERRQPGKESASKQRLRLWLHLLRSARYIESQLRENLRREFGVTLPRFDVLAALDRNPDGLLMSELSRFLMVSNGNVTGIIDRLVDDGMVNRTKRPGDRRTSIVKLTKSGRDQFAIMAERHEGWVGELLGTLADNDVENVSQILHDFMSSNTDERQ